MWRLSSSCLPTRHIPQWPYVVGNRCHRWACPILYRCVGMVWCFQFIGWETGFRVLSLWNWDNPAGFQWLCTYYKVVPICIFISPGSRQENRNHLKNSKQVAFIRLWRNVHTGVKTRRAKRGLQIKSEIPNCRKWLLVRGLVAYRVRVVLSVLQSKLMWRREKGGLLQLALRFCKGHSHSPGDQKQRVKEVKNNSFPMFHLLISCCASSWQKVTGSHLGKEGWEM